jgi:hypothetical protein
VQRGEIVEKFDLAAPEQVFNGARALAANSDGPGRARPVQTVYPGEIKDVLYNPGMGLADCHFGFGHPPSADQHPRQTVVYFRWSWADFEPAEGQYAFDFVDHVIQQAKARGEKLAFRIMTEYGAGSLE